MNIKLSHKFRLKQQMKIENTMKSNKRKISLLKKIPNFLYKSDQFYFRAIVLVTLVSFLTRFYKIDEPAHVCWDETHFGKMASWYLNRTFFFDVHPPLGKMLIALSGHLTGYDGKFAFDKPGDQYDNYSQYLGMRIFCATLGSLIVPLVFVGTKSISKSDVSALVASSFVLFDNGMITLTRYILLDPILLFYVAASFVGFAKISFQYSHFNDEKAQFTKIWWFWLCWTGTFISAAFSVKFVGLFSVVLVGSRTAYDLWQILGDTKKHINYFLKHFAARVLLLIVWPVFLYVILFYVHLKQLDHAGSGDGFYSSAFQSQLIGNSLYNSTWPIHLAYGSVVTLKNNRIGGAYLHSHWHLYPEGVGARQQQVTAYSHKDSNNRWLVKRANLENIDSIIGDIYVRDNDLIILEHVNTKRNLHSHKEQAPITKRHNQVTCYGENGLGDANDIWKVVKEASSQLMKKNEDNRIYTVRSKFKLIHLVSSCALHSHSKQLPKWAYEQMEVTCNPKIFDKNNLWNIEDNYYPSLPNSSFEEYAPSFYEKFIESHAVMFQGNSGLKPKQGEITSRPWQWPLNYRGQFFSASNGQKIYLLGNPTIWWANITALPFACIILLCKLVACERKQFNQSRTFMTRYDDEPGIFKSYSEATLWMIFAWAIHYLPFYFMGRILYFHHYFPAFIFSCIMTALTFDYLTSLIYIRILNLKTSISNRQIETMLALLAIVIYTFCIFTPITYGTKSDMPESSTNSESSIVDDQQLSSLKWLDSWEF